MKHTLFATTILLLFAPVAASADLEATDAREIARPAAGGGGPSGLPSILSSTYPYFATLAQFGFDDGANPDPQGWTTHDLTAQGDVFWHVDDFSGLPAPYAPLHGTKSMWCGIRPGQVPDPAYAGAPGYGNIWTQVLESAVFPWVPYQGAKLMFRLSYDFYNNYDRLTLEYRSGGGAWTNMATFSGSDLSGGVQEYNIAPLDLPGTELQFRFVVSTGPTGSDEMEDSDGAVILDEIYVINTSAGTLVSLEYFESYAVGTTATFSWAGTTPSPFGNFGGLVSGAGVVQTGAPNTSHVWSFFNGSTETYACGGYPGQPAVPKTRLPGSLHIADYLVNEVRSPYIPLSIDQNNQPVDPDFTHVTAEFDAYLDLPLANDVLMTMRHRFLVAGVPTPWNTRGGGWYSDTPGWVHIGPAGFGGYSIPAGATHIQIGVIVVDRAYQAGATGQCHSHAPLIDNVAVHRLYRPYFVTNTNDYGAGSLRQAILSANAADDRNAILFDVPGEGPHIIAPESPLPQVAHPVWIDGFSQAGAAPNQWPFLASTATMKIALDGTWTGAGAHGLDFGPTSWSVMRGMVVGGFEGAGIRTQSTSLIVTGCYIGTDAYGTTAVPNGVGIDALNMQIDVGGPFNEERMVIAGNTGDGIRVHAGSGPIFNVYAGVDAAGNPMWNGGAGIRVLGGTNCQIGEPSWSPCIGPYTNEMLISWNAGGGVVVEAPATGVGVYQARISNNPGLNIDLGADGPTANDALDADTGANGLQNHPVLASATGTTIFGHVDGEPNQLHRVEFFAGPDCDHTTQYLGYEEVTTDGAGHAAFAFTCAAIPPATTLGATAAGAVGTSEYAPCIVSTNTPQGSPLVNLYEPGGPFNGPLRATVQFDAVSTAGNTFLAPASSPPSPAPTLWNVGGSPVYWDITTTAAYAGPIEVCIYYDPAAVPSPESDLRLLHHDGADWVDVTTSIDTDANRVCGTVTSLSPFVVALPVPPATGVGDGPEPTAFVLHAAVPNPFNPATTIQYDIPTGPVDVEIAIFDVSGRLVRTLVAGPRGAGRYAVQWNGEDDRGAGVASGVYLYRMKAGTFVETRKMVLLK